MTTISQETDSVAAVFFAVLGGKFRLRLEDPKAPPGRRFADVLDDQGNRIGGAYDYVYSGTGYAVHTRAFAGYVPEAQIEYVEDAR
jgi:hypothetical protein